ncbi:response regulator transcription factor [Paenibacillus ferrarius]|uniref:response regulator transcription factor n=1 Tax=Paenibacillus ferrarius TaxID=1469647 RepID=UPI003D271D97
MDLDTVMIVDDEAPIRRELRAFPWEEAECRLVAAARNGAEALELFHVHQPSIVITDIVMPVMDGLELIKAIKASESSTQIILMTIFSDFSYAKEAIHYGVTDYLVKGIYTNEELLLALAKARKLKQQLYRSDTPNLNATPSDPSAKNGRLEINSAIQIIKDNLAHEHTLEQLADKVGLSSSYLSKLWKSEVGEGFRVYLTQLRMQKAAELLSTTNLKVYEVAEKVGYSNYRSFAAAFYDCYKINPREYRK